MLLVNPMSISVILNESCKRTCWECCIVHGILTIYQQNYKNTRQLAEVSQTLHLCPDQNEERNARSWIEN